MKCPKCKAEIIGDSEFCIVCGADIKNYAETSEKKDKNDIPSSITIWILVAVFLVSLTIGANINAKRSSGNYKSLVAIENNEIKNKNAGEFLNILIEQERDLQEGIEKLNNEQADKLFKTFYGNLLKFVEKYSEEEELRNLQANNADFLTIKTVEIIGVWINHKYLSEKYSKYLGKIWKDYFKIASESAIMEIESGYYVEILEIVKNIAEEQSFLHKYPRFLFKKTIKETIETQTSNLLFNEYTFSADGSMTQEARQGYEEFLKLTDKNSEEYKVVGTCYNVLQTNNFVLNDDFYKIVMKYSQSEWHKQLYENLQNKDNNNQNQSQEEEQLQEQLETPQEEEQTPTEENNKPQQEQNPRPEEQNQEVSINFEDRGHSREETTSEYRSEYRQTKEFCNEHFSEVDKNGNFVYSDDGGYESCIRKSLEQKNPKYISIYDETMNKCINLTNGNEEEIKQCLEQEFDK